MYAKLLTKEYTIDRQLTIHDSEDNVVPIVKPALEVKNYVYIIEDIRDTLNIDLSFELDLNVLSNNLFKGMFNYGR